MPQSIQVTGNLGRDFNINHLGGQQYVMKCSIVDSERYRDSNGQTQEITTWFNLDVMGSQERLEKMKSSLVAAKGNKVWVHGKMRMNKAQDGRQFWSIRVFANDFSLITMSDENRKAKESNMPQQGAQQGGQNQNYQQNPQGNQQQNFNQGQPQGYPQGQQPNMQQGQPQNMQQGQQPNMQQGQQPNMQQGQQPNMQQGQQPNMQQGQPQNFNQGQQQGFPQGQQQGFPQNNGNANPTGQAVGSFEDPDDEIPF